jgi:hypothetical protein
MPPASNPEIFACLGMVIGLYGTLFLGRCGRGWSRLRVLLRGRRARRFLAPGGQLAAQHEDRDDGQGCDGSLPVPPHRPAIRAAWGTGVLLGFAPVDRQPTTR